MANPDVQTQLAKICQDLRRHKNRVWKTPRTILGVSNFVIQTAMSILSLSSMSYEMAVDWMMGSQRKGF